MNSKAIKLAGSVVGAAALIGGGTITALANDNTPIGNDAASNFAIERSAGEASVEKALAVHGWFSYDQTTLTPNSHIASVFRIAATAACASLPDYGIDGASGLIAVGGSAAQESFEATIDEIAEDNSTQTYIMGCACASNAPGGGAVVNAEVSGVSLAGIADKAGVR